MIRVRGLTKDYGDVRAVDGLDLEVGRGELLGLLGPNGAGKTTTISCLVGILNIDGGTVELFDGGSPSDPGTRGRLGVAPQSLALHNELTGLENLEYILSLAGITKTREELLEELTKVGLVPAAAVRPSGGYSKGMRQKVGLAVALARGSDVLLLDEPLSGLDPRSAKEFCDRIRTLTDQGCAVIMATHDLFRAREIGSRIGIMRAGKILREFDPFEVSGADLEQIYLEQMAGDA